MFIVNIVAMAMFYIDKQRARHHKWRISEKMLFAVALIGGSVGAMAGMWLFHHKTKHWYFVVGMPAILLLQIAAAMWVREHGVM